MVGTSGAWRARLSLDTPSMRMLPVCVCGSASEEERH